MHSLAALKLLALGLSMNWDAELQRLELLRAIGPEHAARLDIVYPDANPTVLAGDPSRGGRRRHPLAAAGDVPRGGALDPDRRWHEQLLGRVRGADDIRPADPLQRPAPGPGHAVDLVRGARPGRRGLRIDRRDHAGHALRDHRPQQACRLGIHQLLRRLPGPGDRGVRTRRPAIASGPSGASSRPDGSARSSTSRARPTCSRRWWSPATARSSRGSRTRSGPSGAGSHCSGRRCSRAAAADGLLRLQRAGDWKSFKEAFASFDAPSQNVVYADVDGHIGYLLSGRMPVRKRKPSGLPVQGWTGDAVWTRYLTPDEMPADLRPARAADHHRQQPHRRRQLPVLHRHRLHVGVPRAAHRRAALASAWSTLRTWRARRWTWSARRRARWSGC